MENKSHDLSYISEDGEVENAMMNVIEELDTLVGDDEKVIDQYDYFIALENGTFRIKVPVCDHFEEIVLEGPFTMGQLLTAIRDLYQPLLARGFSIDELAYGYLESLDFKDGVYKLHLGT